jgi:hypothetical protein
VSEELEHLVSGPFAVERPGYDGQAYAWYIGPKRLEIRFSQTAIEVGEEGVSVRTEQALKSLGRSEIIEFLSWEEPPDWVEFSTDNLPWIEGGVLERE